jgi:hypothetical protein
MTVETGVLSIVEIDIGLCFHGCVASEHLVTPFPCELLDREL